MSKHKFVSLTGGSPWGFRLVGGKDFHANLAVSKVTPNGKADLSGVQAGDLILEINQTSTSELSHLEAQNMVKNAGYTLVLKLDASGQNNGASYQQSTPAAPATNSQKHTSTVTFTPSVPKSNANTWQPKATTVTLPKPEEDLPPPPDNLSYGMQNMAVNDPMPPPPPASNTTTTYAPPSHKKTYAPPPSNMYNPPPSNKYAPPSQTSTATKDDKDCICAGCKQLIRGPYLTALGQCWHPEEFVCGAANCRKPLQNIGFIEEEGKMYCKECYEKHFAHTCGKCKTKIIGEVMHALNQTWHMTCFVCTACSKPFTDGVFHLENDRPYCVDDYNRLFSSNCKGCTFPIAAGDHYLEALGAQWHDSCFTCAVCHCDLKSSGFFASGEKPVCQNHKNARVSQ